MDRETIASLHEVKEAVLQQQTIDLREARGRLDAMEAERAGVIEAMGRESGAGTVAEALTATRYRTFQKQALARLDERIAVAARDHDRAEAALTETFAEVRAIEQLQAR